MTSNKSLERTVRQSGRTVRAVALCARAGAEEQRRAAVQRNRYTSPCASNSLAGVVPGKHRRNQRGCGELGRGRRAQWGFG